MKSNISFDNQINDKLTPENCCSYYSTTIGETSLKAKGYGDRLYLAEGSENNCDNELLIAPWNTTMAYLTSLKQKQRLLNVNDYNEDGFIVFTNQSYKDFKVNFVI